MGRRWTAQLLRAVREADASGLDADDIADLTDHPRDEVERALALRRMPLGHAVDRLNGQLIERAWDAAAVAGRSGPRPDTACGFDRSEPMSDASSWSVGERADRRLVQACLELGGLPRAEPGRGWRNLHGDPWVFGQAVRG
jgi:hypothetical protein